MRVKPDNAEERDNGYIFRVKMKTFRYTKSKRELDSCSVWDLYEYSTFVFEGSLADFKAEAINCVRPLAKIYGDGKLNLYVPVQIPKPQLESATEWIVYLGYGRDITRLMAAMDAFGPSSAQVNTILAELEATESSYWLLAIPLAKTNKLVFSMDVEILNTRNQDALALQMYYDLVDADEDAGEPEMEIDQDNNLLVHTSQPQ